MQTSKIYHLYHVLMEVTKSLLGMG